MTAFQLSENIDKNRVFLVNKSQIEKRLDPFYYVPELMELEEKVWQKNPQKLIHYAKAVSSGATPKTTESEKYYTDKKNGIPFLRVQNLTSAGMLKLDNVKFINKETHNGMLARSKVKEGDLLIKITGVGRMAVSSVAPEGFEGNVNQHMVVMKTDSPETSKILAAFLNSDIGEKLASRRATGGTRPALDYPALLSIPIIYGERILKITEAAVKKKEAKEQQAKNLLASIDDYLLGELGITLPEKDGGLEKRMFTIQFANLSGNRFDPFYFHPFFQENFENIAHGRFPLKPLRNLMLFMESGSRPKGGVSNIEDGVWSIGGEHVGDQCEVGIGTPKYIPEDFHKKILLTKTKLHDIILVKDGATTGKIGIITEKDMVDQNINEHVFLIRPDETEINPFYLVNYLHSIAGQTQIKREITGATVTGLTKQAVRGVHIPLPPLKKQIQIADRIRQIREQAKQLQREADKELEKASREVEQIIKE
ncbi:MAG: restriction endonuclease subunit S [Bacteroidales bacterium]|nr:restriction endonuclease subunit S [Bacteroidales bacterium]